MFLMPLLSNAQNKQTKKEPAKFDAPVSPTERNEIPLDIVMEQAKFPGGNKAFIKFLQVNLKYPETPLRNSIQGIVRVRFLVEKDGSINQSSIELARSVHPDLDAEALRVIRLSPNWIPAMQAGKPINQRVLVPISFRIDAPVITPKK